MILYSSSLTRDVDKRDKQLHLYTCYLVKISHGEIKLSHFVANKTLKSHLEHKQNMHILKALKDTDIVISVLY